jgi:hypothetical protein
MSTQPMQLSENYLCTCGKIITTCDYFTIYKKDCSDKPRPLAKKIVDAKEACLDELMNTYYKTRRVKLLHAVSECHELTKSCVFNMDLNTIIGNYLLPATNDYRKIFTAETMFYIAFTHVRYNKQPNPKHLRYEQSGRNKRKKL